MQHATKFVSMYGHNLNIPLIIRTPMGGGRGYGPTHSQSIEKFFIGIPNLLVIAINHRISPQDIYVNIFENTCVPTLIIENKRVYTIRSEHPVSKYYNYAITDEVFPVLNISSSDKSRKAVVTIICYGGALIDVEECLDELFYEHEVICEIFTPTNISTFDINGVVESLSITKRLLSVEEGSSISSWSSNVISNLILNNIQFKLQTLGNNSLIPASVEAEKQVLLSAGKIKKCILEFINE